MARRIVIFGGLEDSFDRQTLLSELTANTHAIEWDWVKAEIRDGWRPPKNPFNRLMAQLQAERGLDKTTVVLLRRVNKDIKNRLLSVYPDPVLVDPDQATGPELISWLLSPAAGLIPELEWRAETREAAFFC